MQEVLTFVRTRSSSRTKTGRLGLPSLMIVMLLICGCDNQRGQQPKEPSAQSSPVANEDTIPAATEAAPAAWERQPFPGGSYDSEEMSRLAQTFPCDGCSELSADLRDLLFDDLAMYLELMQGFDARSLLKAANAEGRPIQPQLLAKFQTSGGTRKEALDAIADHFDRRMEQLRSEGDPDTHVNGLIRNSGRIQVRKIATEIMKDGASLEPDPAMADFRVFGKARPLIDVQAEIAELLGDSDGLYFADMRIALLARDEAGDSPQDFVIPMALRFYFNPQHSRWFLCGYATGAESSLIILF